MHYRKGIVGYRPAGLAGLTFKSSGSLAMFAAIRRASSRVSNNDDGKIPLSSQST
jgi:hypothetical protein